VTVEMVAPFTGDDLFGPESRDLQDRFDTRRLADRITEHFVRPGLDPNQAAVIRAARMVFVATVSPNGDPQVSYKGGRPGFVRVLDPRTLALPFYDGNGMFSSLGNIRATGRIGLLFIDFETGYRLRVNGTAVVDADPDTDRDPGAKVLATVTTEVVYDLCERYVHKLRFESESEYSPAPGHDQPPAPYLSTPLYDGARPGEPAEHQRREEQS
jgi:predicted pyridoxine 5'-phosphate oxidase superfamily flavin-nucleotide-binding protein